MECLLSNFEPIREVSWEVDRHLVLEGYEDHIAWASSFLSRTLGFLVGEESYLDPKFVIKIHSNSFR